MKSQNTTPRLFRGIRTVEDLKGRCIVDDFTECWHWQGAMHMDGTGKRSPAAHIWDSVRQEARTMTGPLFVLEVAGRRGLGVKMGWRTCQCNDCVNPEHVAGGTRKDWGRWVAATGTWKNNPARAVANRRAARERSPLSPEIVAEIRASDLTGRELAVRHGLKVRHVSHIRCGTTWKDAVLPGASVFTLGARNA